MGDGALQFLDGAFQRPGGRVKSQKTPHKPLHKHPLSKRGYAMTLENEILTGPLPNPSETARLEITTTEHEPLANANEHHQRHAHSFKQAKSKVV